jgi:hypothetical protein
MKNMTMYSVPLPNIMNQFFSQRYDKNLPEKRIAVSEQIRSLIDRPLTLDITKQTKNGKMERKKV